MKKVLTLLIICSFANISFAQLKPKTYIYNRPLGFLMNSFEVGFDKKVGANNFFGAMIGYGASEENYYNGYDMEELKLEINFKTFIRNYYQKHTYYVQPFILFKQRKEDGYDYWPPSPSSNMNYKSSAIQIGFMFAKRFNWNRIFLDLQVGGGVISPISGTKDDRYYLSDPSKPYSKGVHPRIGLNFGINI